MMAADRELKPRRVYVGAYPDDQSLMRTAGGIMIDAG